VHASRDGLCFTTWAVAPCQLEHIAEVVAKGRAEGWELRTADLGAHQLCPTVRSMSVLIGTGLKRPRSRFAGMRNSIVPPHLNCDAWNLRPGPSCMKRTAPILDESRGTRRGMAQMDRRHAVLST
jgi:hypothetical protein